MMTKKQLQDIIECSNQTCNENCSFYLDRCTLDSKELAKTALAYREMLELRVYIH